MHTQPFTPGPAPDAGPPVYQLSGWWRRVGATLIDGMLIGISNMLIEVVLDLAFNTKFLIHPSNQFFPVRQELGTLVIVFLLYIPWVVLLMSKTNGRTIGKIATGIRVVREDGMPITFGYALRRELLIKYILFNLLSVVTLFIGSLLDSLWPLWDDQNCALHDHVAGSRVVLASWQPAPPYVPLGPPSAGYPPSQQTPFPYAPPAPPPTPPPA